MRIITCALSIYYHNFFFPYLSDSPWSRSIHGCIRPSCKRELARDFISHVLGIRLAVQRLHIYILMFGDTALVTFIKTGIHSRGSDHGDLFLKHTSAVCHVNVCSGSLPFSSFVTRGFHSGCKGVLGFLTAA